MEPSELDILKRALEREKAARKAAEKILEEKSTELYETAQQLKASNTKLEELITERTSELQGVFENIIDAYVVMDLWGNVLKMNEAAITLLGYNNSEEEFNLLSLADVSDVDNVMTTFDELMNEGSVTNFQVRINTKSGLQKLVQINASLILDGKCNPVAAQGIVRDITELKSLELQKENLLQALEKSNDELHEYAHIVSHDLKSPLRSIYALVSWLKQDNQDKLDEASLENIGLIETTLEKMEQLISDILEYSSIGTSEKQKADVDLNMLVPELIDILYVPEHIEINLKSQLPVIVGDKTKLQQLFQNLISNAIKFIDKPKGLIDIDVEEQKEQYKFSIKDNGIGIDEKFHSKIFKVFHALNKSKDSTGVGLSIVKKIVDLHKGKIWLESEPGKGTTFYFTLKKEG